MTATGTIAARTARARGQAAGEASSAIATLERELAHLARSLEAVQRKRAYPLDRAQYLLLTLLEERGPQPIASLADRLVLDDSTVTRQVAAMEDRRLIDRVPHPQDGRSTLIRATRHGLQLVAQMRDMRLGRIALLFEDWSEKDRAGFAAQMTKLNAALRRSLQEPT